MRTMDMFFVRQKNVNYMVVLCYGTRPEWIKIKPLIEEFKKNDIEYKILFTGQQVDIAKFERDWIIEIENGLNRLDSIVKSITNNSLSEFIKYVEVLYELGTCKTKLTHILVQGDTTSALALALSAFHHGMKVIHLEAGLRTYDKENPYPEEINRRIISQIADVHLCPTQQNAQNLYNEHVDSKNIYVVGNTAIDNLLPWYDEINDYSNEVLITMHRRENHHWLKEWFEAINEIAIKHDYINFIFPAHPNPKVQDNLKYFKAPNIKIIKPVEHGEMLNLLVNSRLVITDSGGLQEECSFFNKKCLVCRKVTERPEAVGQSSVLVKSPSDLSPIFDKYVVDFRFQYECPFGDGHSAEKITQILKEIIK